MDWPEPTTEKQATMRKFFANIFKRIETRLACRRSDFVKFLGEVIQRLENEVATLRTELDVQAARHAKAFGSENRRHAELNARQSEAIDAAVNERELQLAELRQQHADAIATYERKLAAMKHDYEAAMESADEQLADAERRYAALERELADAKHENELTTRSLEVAEEENDSIWEVIERDRARVQAERSAYQRDAAEAQNAARSAGVEVIEEE